jgi:hypothetical protein
VCRSFSRIRERRGPRGASWRRLRARASSVRRGFGFGVPSEGEEDVDALVEEACFARAPRFGDGAIDGGESALVVAERLIGRGEAVGWVVVVGKLALAFREEGDGFLSAAEVDERFHACAVVGARDGRIRRAPSAGFEDAESNARGFLRTVWISERLLRGPHHAQGVTSIVGRHGGEGIERHLLEL